MVTNHKNPSILRVCRQFFYMPILHTHWLNDDAKAFLAEKTREAEKHHRGEIRLVIENTLPVFRAYHLTPRDRAIELFSELRLWDTQYNTGVLVYINICEHDLQIVADRGINHHVAQATWQAMCDKALTGIKAGNRIDSLADLLLAVGEQLKQFYDLADDPAGNEIANTVVYLD